MPDLDPQALANLDPASRQEIMQWIEAESSKSKVQSSIHNFTDLCFKKCITGKITSSNLDRNEETCLQNCLNRFLDTNINIVKLNDNKSNLILTQKLRLLQSEKLNPIYDKILGAVNTYDPSQIVNLAAVAPLLCDLIKPLPGEWIWYKTDLSDSKRLKTQKIFTESVPLLLRLLCDILAISNHEDNDGSDNDIYYIQIIEVIACYKCLGYPWSSESSYKLACQLEISIRQSKNEKIITALIENTIKPMFSNPTHSDVSSAGRRRYTQPVNSRFSTNETEETYKKPWRSTYQGSIAVLEFILVNLKGASDDSNIQSIIKHYWPLLVPSILNIIDDYEALIKSKGCEISKHLFEIVDKKFLLTTGLGPIFWDALKPCLLYLPPSTPPEVSTILVRNCIHSLVALANKDNNSKESRLNEIMRDGVFKGISQAGQQNIQVITMLLEEIPFLSFELNVAIVRHLNQLIGIFVNILCDPFIGGLPNLIVVTCEAMLGVMNNGWPRIDAYKYDVLRGVVKSWQSQEINNSNTSNSEMVHVSLRKVITKLENILGKDSLNGDYIALVKFDGSLKDLFEL